MEKRNQNIASAPIKDSLFLDISHFINQFLNVVQCFVNVDKNMSTKKERILLLKFLVRFKEEKKFWIFWKRQINEYFHIWRRSL